MPPETVSLDNLQVFYREATAVRTEVVAYLAGADTAGLELRGDIQGPLARHAKTLPLRTSFETNRVAGGALLATAILNETCFWEPSAPHWYMARLSLCRGGDVIDACERIVGVRPVAVTADGLRLNGRAYVLRAVSSAKMTEQIRDACLAEKMALALDPAADADLTDADAVTDADLATASDSGLPLIVPVGGTAAEVIAELRRLSRWPAVVLAVVNSPEQLPESLQLECPNMLLAETAVKGRPIAAWAHLAIVDTSSDIDVGGLSVPAISRLSDQADGTLTDRIATAGAFEPSSNENTDHGQAVGCIV